MKFVKYVNKLFQLHPPSPLQWQKSSDEKQHARLCRDAHDFNENVEVNCCCSTYECRVQSDNVARLNFIRRSLKERNNLWGFQVNVRGAKRIDRATRRN